MGPASMHTAQPASTTHQALAAWRARGQIESVGAHRLFVVDTTADGSPPDPALPPVLFLHGFPTASFDYARLAPLLPGRRLIFFDCLGFGFSDKPTRHPYALVEQATLAEQILAARGLHTVAVVGHDMGSSVALILLERARVTVTHLVLLNGSILLQHYRPLITQRLLLNRLTGPLISALGLINRPVFDRQFSRLFPTPPPAEELAAFWSLITEQGGQRIYHRLIGYLRDRRAHELTWFAALTQHTAPLLILWGQLDVVSRPAIGEAIAAARPDARMRRLTALGHYPQWDDPVSIAAELDAFLPRS